MATLYEEGAKSSRNLIRFPFNASGGEANRVYSRQLQLLDSDWIALESSSGAMGLVAVEFDSESLPLPVGVDLVPCDEVVDRRPWQARAPHEVNEETFGSSSRHGRVSINRRGNAQPLAAGMTTAAYDDGVDRVDVKQSQSLCFLKHAFNLSL